VNVVTVRKLYEEKKKVGRVAATEVPCRTMRQNMRRRLNLTRARQYPIGKLETDGYYK
jgi:hypothetical protein